MSPSTPVPVVDKTLVNETLLGKTLVKNVLFKKPPFNRHGSGPFAPESNLSGPDEYEEEFPACRRAGQ